MSIGKWRRSGWSVKERFDSLTCPEPNSGCLIWIGALTAYGYGWFRPNPDDRSTRVQAHRMAWLLEHGGIRDGLNVLHECDVRLCVNTRHLFLGTSMDNNIDMARKGRGRKSTRGLPYGVKFDPRATLRPYSAHVTFNRKRHDLGCFATLDEASAVAMEFKRMILGTAT